MSMLFVVLTLLFLIKIGEPVAGVHFSLPKLFSVSTVLILVSSFIMHQVPVFYKQDNVVLMKKRLGWVVTLGFAFALSQVVAWYEMGTKGVLFTGEATNTFLYLLSALHLLHVAGGLAFSAFFFLKTSRAAGDSIRTLIFIRDPFRRMQLDMLRSYWHFLDILWIALYFVFLFAL